MRKTDVILKNKNGEDVTFTGISKIVLPASDEGEVEFSRGRLSTAEVDLDFSHGTQVVFAPDDELYDIVEIKMPDTFIPENIAEGVEIAGVIGTFEGAGDKPKLNKVTISRSGDTITISNPSTNGNFAKTYKIYNGDEVIKTQAVGTNTFSVVGFQVHGTLVFGVSVSAELFDDSDLSTLITVTTYTIERDLTNLTSTSSQALIVQALTHSTTLKPDEDKFIPEDIEVTMGGSICNYNWNYDTGELSVPNISGDVVITATADDEYQIRRPKCTLSGNELSVIPHFSARHTKVYISGVEIYDIETYYTIEVQNVEGVTYGFTKKDTGYYESTNNGKDNTFSMCQIICFTNTPRNLTLDCINYAESNYDYGIISQPNQSLAKSNADDGTTGSTKVFHNFRGESSTAVKRYSIPLPAGTCIIQIKYRKDGSQSTGNDSFQFKIIEE